jgi:hypothetical protein
MARHSENQAAAGDLLAAALRYATLGLWVLPLHSAPGGVCTCGAANCNSPGKHPRTSNGLTGASTDVMVISEWWRRWPTANIAVRTGPESGVAVLDVDPRHGGLVSLEKLKRKNGRLPNGPQTLTGSGGQHRWFRYPEGGIRNSTGVLGKGLDVRGEAGYVVVPPSIHASGNVYKWKHPFDRDALQDPGALFADATKRRNGAPKVTDVIPEGKRREAMLMVAGALKRKGLTGDEILPALRKLNERCRPPLDEAELESVAHESTIETDPAAAIPTVEEEELPPVDGDVDGAVLLDAVAAHLRQFMVIGEAELVVVVLFVVVTYAVDAFTVVCYLRVVSPTKRTGKSRLLELLEFLVHRPVKTGGLSEAALFRSLANGSATLLFDEIGKVLGEAARDRNSSVEAIFLNGYAAGTPVLRCVGEGTRQVVTEFPVYGAKVLAGVGTLDDMINDRSWPIGLKRKTRGEKVERFRRRDASEAAAPLRAQMKAWTEAHLDELAAATPELPEQLDDRAQDVAECLLAVADLAGGGWPERARRTVIALRGNSDLADDEIGVELLADIRKAFDTAKTDRFPTDELLLALRQDDERPWKTWKRGEPINARQLAGLLRGFEIRSRVIRIDASTTAKGYLKEQFEDAWKRYTP